MKVYKARYAGFAPVWYTPYDHLGRNFNLIEGRGMLGRILYPIAECMVSLSNLILALVDDEYGPCYPLTVYTAGEGR